MKEINFYDIEDFVDDVIEKHSSIKPSYDSISIISKYDIAKEIIKQLVLAEYDIVSIDISKEDHDFYYDEYVISIDSEGIWCQKAKVDNKYVLLESDVIYILDDCSSKIIPYCNGDIVYEVSIGEDEYDEIDEYECLTTDTSSQSTTISRNKDGVPTGFSKTWSNVTDDGISYYSSYSHYSNDIDCLRKVAEDFGVDL